MSAQTTRATTQTSTDLIDRLTVFAGQLCKFDLAGSAGLVRESAGEINRLRGERDILRLVARGLIAGAIDDGWDAESALGTPGGVAREFGPAGARAGRHARVTARVVDAILESARQSARKSAGSAGGGGSDG